MLVVDVPGQVASLVSSIPLVKDLSTTSTIGLHLQQCGIKRYMLHA
jgi:hypothetical protein